MPDGAMAGSPAWSGFMPGPEGGVIPGRRHDAAGEASGGRHLALTVPGPGASRRPRAGPGEASWQGRARPAQRESLGRGLPAAALGDVYRRCPAARVARPVARHAGNPGVVSAVSAISRGIGAASALGAQERAYGKEKVYGSIP